VAARAGPENAAVESATTAKVPLNLKTDLADRIGHSSRARRFTAREPSTGRNTRRAHALG
jgi:hypothetical protein